MDDTTTLADGPEADGGAGFRWRIAHRPDLRFGHAAGGVAGILIAAAILSFVVEVTDDDPTLPGVGFNVVLIAAAIAVGFFVRGPVRSAAVTAIVAAIPQVWIFAIVGDGRDFGSRGDFRLILLLSTATYAVGYLLTWTRGRAVLLGFALLFASSWFVFEIASQDAPFALDIASQVQVEGFDDPSSALAGSDDNTTETAIASLVVALVTLGGGVLLDRRGRAGAATPMLLIGSLYAVVAAVTFGTDVDDVYAGGAFVAIAGLAIGLAGSLGRRRGTSWLGAVVLVLGVLTVVAQGTEDTVSGDGGAAVFGAYALLGAAVLLVVGILVARRLAEPVDGGEPFTPRPPKPESPRDGDGGGDAGAGGDDVAVAAPGAPAATTVTDEPPAVAWSAPAPAAPPAPPATPEESAGPAPGELAPGESASAGSAESGAPGGSDASPPSPPPPAP